MDCPKLAHSSHEHDELGSLLAEFTYRGSRVQRTWMILGIMCTVIVVAAPIGLILLGVAFLRNPRVRAYAKGLEIVHGNRQEICLWRDVDAFWQQLTVNQITLAGLPVAKGSTIYKCRLRRRDGKEFKFEENYKNVEFLGETIRTQTFPQLYAAARIALDRGKKVAFGSIWLSKEELGSDHGAKKWEELRGFDVWIADGLFHVAKGWKRTWVGDKFEDLIVWKPICDIPNFTVLLALVAKHIPISDSIQRAFLSIPAARKAKAV